MKEIVKFFLLLQSSKVRTEKYAKFYKYKKIMTNAKNIAVTSYVIFAADDMESQHFI
jgi:hypothetical protein